MRLLWDWPCRGPPFTLHVVVGWGIPLAEHLMCTSEPIILSWLSGSNTHSGGSENTQSAWCYQYKEDTEHLQRRTQSQESLSNMYYSVKMNATFTTDYTQKWTHKRLFRCLQPHHLPPWYRDYTIMHYLELFLTPSFTHTTMFNIAIKTKEADSENACLCNQIFIFQWYLKLFFFHLRLIWGK